MPRTKLAKNTKRNRDAIERLKDFDITAQHAMDNFDATTDECIRSLESELKLLKVGIPKTILVSNLTDFLNMNVKKYSEFKQVSNNRSRDEQVIITSTRKNSHDDGYLTEDSTKSGRSSHQSVFSSFPSIARTPDVRGRPLGRTPDIRGNLIGRPPGPLQSAKAKFRRSRSACDSSNFLTKKSSSVDRASRCRINNLTTSARPKAQSADRAAVTPKMSSNSPPAVYRWPRPGELVISLSGSPLVAQASSDTVANINIPIRNGVLSLRPKKLNEINEIADQLAPETVEHIRVLQSTIDQILKRSDNN